MKATLHSIRYFDGCYLRSRYHIELPTKNRLEYMQKAVGGLIEIYHYDITGRDWVMNEEGLILDLPLNPWALEQGVEVYGNIIEIHGILD